jgi:RNA polymerase sigma-70 factor (ECF subfamily)
MARTPAGDEGFDELFRSEYPALVRRLRLVVGSAAVAEEIAQDAFCVALERWPRVRTLERPGAWVQVVAMRRAFKHEGRRRTGAALEPAWGPATDAAPVDVDLERAIAELPDGQRRAIVLHHLADLAVNEVAEVLGVSAGTVKTQLHRGRVRLAEVLHEPEEVRDGAG